MGIERVGIVGSGIMGSGIAEVAAMAGFDVLLRSRKPETAQAMVTSLDQSLARQVAKGRIADAEREATLGRVGTTTDLSDLARCDLVLESVVEDLGVKKELFADLDGVVKDGAILASDTSTLSITELARQTGRPELVCGLHFFNPAPAMKLVEVVRGEATSDETVTEAMEFARRCGKNPVEVADRTGFIVNALLFPYLNNAVRMLEDGVATAEGIDAAMRDGCGFPMGPFELLDLVGLDTSLAIIEALHEGLGDANYEPRSTLRKLVEQGMLGRKTGEGFHRP